VVNKDFQSFNRLNEYLCAIMQCSCMCRRSLAHVVDWCSWSDRTQRLFAATLLHSAEDNV